MNGEFRWYHQTGICHEVDYQASTPSVTKCISGQNLTTISKFEILIDLPTLMFVWGITFLGSYFKSGSLINKLERASHLSKDAGELAATVGAVLTFAGVFHEAAMASAFRYIFMLFSLDILQPSYLSPSRITLGQKKKIIPKLITPLRLPRFSVQVDEPILEWASMCSAKQF